MELAESALRSDGRLGQEGNAHELLMPKEVEKEHLRGVMSRRSSLGVGGGGEGRYDGEDMEEQVPLLKLKVNGIVVVGDGRVESLGYENSRETRR